MGLQVPILFSSLTIIEYIRFDTKINEVRNGLCSKFSRNLNNDFTDD